MANLKSVEENFADYKRRAPLTGAIGSNIGMLAAWMDLSAAYCGLPCSVRSTTQLDRLAKQVCWAVQSVVPSSQILNNALNMAYYPFVTANGVIWAIWQARVSLVVSDEPRQEQMQGISKGDAMRLSENTQRILAWKAEIALRHGGDYKMYIEQMLEPLSGFAELAEQRAQFVQASMEIQMNARVMNMRISSR